MVPEVNIVLVCPGQPCLGRLDHCAMFFVKVKRTNPQKGAFLGGGEQGTYFQMPHSTAVFFWAHRSFTLLAIGHAPPMSSLELPGTYEGSSCQRFEPEFWSF